MKIPKRYHYLVLFVAVHSGLLAMGGVLIVEQTLDTLLVGLMYGVVVGMMVGTAMEGFGALIMYSDQLKPKPAPKRRVPKSELIYGHKEYINY